MSEERVEQLLGALENAPAEPDPDFVSRLGRLVHDEATERAVSSITPTNEYMGEPIMIDLDIETTEQSSSEQQSRRQPTASVIRRAAALVLVVGVAAAAIFVVQDDPPANVASQGPMATVDEFFDAFNAGDSNRILSLFSADAELSQRFGAIGEFEAGDLADWAEEVDDFIAQEVELSLQSCAEPEVDQLTGASTFSCNYDFSDAPTQAVGAPPMPVTTRFVVTPIGVLGAMQINYNPEQTATEPGIDFLHVGRPFGRWMLANHPEFAGLAITDAPVADCCNSMSPTERGLLVLQYAREWADYLEANGCAYLDGC